MTSLPFSKKLCDERAAVQFIESSLIFTSILLVISALIVIGVTGIRLMIENEILYSTGLDYVNEKEVDDRAFLDRLAQVTGTKADSFSLKKKEGLLGRKMEVYKNDKRVLSVSRTKSQDFIRLADYAAYAFDELSSIKIKGRSLDDLINERFKGIKDLIGHEK